MKMPGVIRQGQYDDLDWPTWEGRDGFWRKARPLPFYTIGAWLRTVWLVATGRADAFIWEKPSDDPWPAGQDEARGLLKGGCDN